MKEIKLTQGTTTLVDDEDFNKLNEYNWFLIKGGYVQRKYNCYLHRQIMNCPDGMEIDHIDGNKLNNQKSNLRICTRSQNMMNRKKVKKASSIYKGVYYQKTRKKYQAYINFNLKSYFLGYFDNEQDAGRAYNKKAIEFFGEFAQLNNI